MGDNDLITVIQRNIDTLVVDKKAVEEGILHGKPHVWGYPVEDLIEPLDILTNHTLTSASSTKKKNTKETDNMEGQNTEMNNGSNHFDHILVADCIFNRSEHERLLKTIATCLKKETGIAWVTLVI